MLKTESVEKPEKTEIKTKKISEKDFEKEVIELAKKGLTSEKIGQELKKKEIHSKDYEKKISKILKANGIIIITDLKNVELKLEKIKKHLKENKQDKRAIREKDRIFSQVKKIKDYHRLN